MAFALSENALREALVRFLRPSDDRIALVYERSGTVSGVFFGHIDRLWFSHETCGFDDLLFVAPGARGRMAAARMLRRYEEWCRKKGCSAALVGVSSGVMMDRTGRMLERLGYGRIGGLYRRHF